MFLAETQTANIDNTTFSVKEGQIGKAKWPVADNQCILVFTLDTPVSVGHKGLDHWFRG